jgi:hypothetical protein
MTRQKLAGSVGGEIDVSEVGQDAFLLHLLALARDRPHAETERLPNSVIGIARVADQFAHDLAILFVEFSHKFGGRNLAMNYPLTTKICTFAKIFDLNLTFLAVL